MSRFGSWLRWSRLSLAEQSVPGLPPNRQAQATVDTIHSRLVDSVFTNGGANFAHRCIHGSKYSMRPQTSGTCSTLTLLRVNRRALDKRKALVLVPKSSPVHLQISIFVYSNLSIELLCEVCNVAIAIRLLQNIFSAEFRILKLKTTI